MKKKFIVGIMLITFCFSIFSTYYKVSAYTGELDPESYIYLPETIYISDGIGTGTISLSSSASGYDISYQKIDITETTFNNIKNKSKELNDYIEENSNTLKEKEANLRTLQTEYKTLYNSGTATTEQLTEAQNKYNEAYEDYEKFYNTVSANITTLQNEFYSIIPEYTNSWTATTNTSNNVQLDFKNYTGTAHFILWVKITNGTNTYYDMNGYSSEIKQDETISINRSTASVKVDESIQLTASSSINSKITWTSSNSFIATVDANGLVKGIKEGTAVITAKGSEKTATCTITVNSKNDTDPGDEQVGDWTDFTNAKFELKKDGVSKAIIEISNVTPKENRNYYLFINSNNSKPNVTSDISDERIDLTYDSNKKIFKTTDSSRVAKYVELNQDLYVTVLETESYDNENIVLYGKKLERYDEPKYSDAFHATFMTYDTDQLVTTFTHSGENNRKMQIKVGKITDATILQKIKNKDSSGFASLLSFAKSNEGIYNKIVDADVNDSYAIEYCAGSGYSNGKDVIKLNGLKDDAYYFLYVKTDDENGKYITQEAVTLAQANVVDDKWFMFFYGSSDFQWADFGDTNVDDTIVKGELPHAGTKTIIWTSVIVILIGFGTFSYIQYKRNNF